jgi:hypothetical protein
VYINILRKKCFNLCSSVQWDTALYCVVVNCTALKCVKVRCTALYCVVLRCTDSNYGAMKDVLFDIL